ncbi:hypothetical protein ASG29_10450 [Sphingomonas sp. Leaf412]|nr:hypothetical protein ASG29_10450 [Sphingomonas sp. Leaf412]
MKAEVDAIDDDGAALTFAIGCVWGAAKERILSRSFAARSMQFATIAGMLAISLLSALMTKRMIAAHHQSTVVFTLTSVLFAAAALRGYLRGPMALVQIARSVLPIYVLAYAFTSSGPGPAGGWIDARLYQALAIEGIGIWTAILLAGVFMIRVGTLPTITRM